MSPTIEYCTPIWSMACPTHLTKLESIINFFVAIVRARVPELRAFSNRDLMKILNIKSPRAQCNICVLLLLHKIVKGNIQCKALLSQINFRVPIRRTRNESLFYVNKPRINLVQRSLINRITTKYNCLPQLYLDVLVHMLFISLLLLLISVNVSM